MVPTITITISIDVPDGASVTTGLSTDPEKGATDQTGLDRYPEVRRRVEHLVPSAYRPFVVEYANRCVDELGCTLAVPDGERRDEYFNVYPPARCRQNRVAGVTYSSSRTAIFAGRVDLNGFNLAEETFNSGEYAYPKLPHLSSEEAVVEALDLTGQAIDRLER